MKIDVTTCDYCNKKVKEYPLYYHVSIMVGNDPFYHIIPPIPNETDFCNLKCLENYLNSIKKSND